MKQYESYKPSGTPWIGDIPSHWEVMKIAHLYNFIGSGTTPATGVKEYYDEGGINWLQTGDLSDGAIYGTSKHISLLAKKELNLKLYPEGSLVVAMYGATVGKLGLLNVPTTVNQACCVLVNSKRLYNKFSFYSFLAAKKSLIVLSTGGGQPNISQDIIRNHHTIVPPIDEQVAIADYLDRKCESIDKAIATQERRIELLTELKQSIITEAVTRGLNPDAPLKDSGIDWIGQIPEHWEVRRIKTLSPVKRGASPRPIEDLKYFDDNGDYAWVRIADVSASDKYLLSTEQTLSELGSSLSVKREPGDIFISIAGTVGKPIITKIKCCIHDGFVWFPNLKFYNELLFYIFLSGRPYLGLGKWGTQLNLNTDTIGCIHIPVPPMEEQKSIVQRLEKKLQPVDSAIAKAKREIDLLREFKQSVITEAVTGKIKVC